MTAVQKLTAIETGAEHMSSVHRIALVLAWVTMAGSAIVFTEPAPFDVFGMGLLVLLPAIGLLRASRALWAYAAVMLVPVAGAFFAILMAIEPPRALTHTAVTLFLTTISLVLAAFIGRAPVRHARLILSGVTTAAVIAASAGLAGYLGLFPGAYELFTLYGRVSGTFKDPNVFGASLVLPAVYLISVLLAPDGRRKGLALVAAGLLMLGILLSFSRGAWFSLVIAAALFGYLSFVTAATSALRARIVIGFGGAAVACGLLVTIALQFDAVADLLSERATLTQSYDEGPEGRFGGQVKAERLILSHPFGLGAQQFDGYYHVEEAHNVYLTMFMNAGWLGGMIFALMVAVTCIYGAWFALQRTTVQRMFLVAYAAFVGHALEGFVIDLDHWRHFHLLLALCWGLMLSDRVPVLVTDLAWPVRVRPARTLAAHIAS